MRILLAILLAILSSCGDAKRLPFGIKEGMTYREVRNAIGRDAIGGTAGPDVRLRWKIGDQYIAVIFKDGRVVDVLREITYDIKHK